MKKRIALLGSTGSIGVQTLEVIESHSERFAVSVLTAQNNVGLLIDQAKKFLPAEVVIGNTQKYSLLKDALKNLPIHVSSGIQAMNDAVVREDVDMVLTAVVGYAGLIPTTHAIKAGKDIALANKETLVVAGDLITELAARYGSKIIPVDSEHSAIFQSLLGEDSLQMEKIILTASGGPFRGKKRNALVGIKKEQALKHPNWDMGAKITIDSASMMNKGLEVIEAKWLFGLNPDQIEVVVHPQSIIHSLVQFKDSSIKAQMGLPDMRLPILFALGYPERIPSNFERFSFLNYPTLSFEPPDTETFRNLAIAFEALKLGGNVPCTINAANEVAVEAFLQDRIGFLEMSDVIEKCMHQIDYIEKPGITDYVATDSETRILASSLI
jgi:1-deoxy-D-xylulose-5-phosphate reductoisomerase